MEAIKLFIFVIASAAFFVWMVLFILVTRFVREDLFKKYYGEKFAIYSGFSIFKRKYYKREKVWVCQGLRFLLPLALLLYTSLWVLV